MNQETISIIVPVYNMAPYLERCVKSLLCQSYPALEIILVNDGSTDESGLLCDRYAQQDSRIRVLHKQNGGLISAWQAGVRESTGAYLSFVDSDDWIHPEMISAMAAELTPSGSEIICANHIITGGGREIKVRQGLAPGNYEGSGLEEVFRDLLGHEQRKITLSRCMKLISRELITKNLSLCDRNLKMGEDVNIMLPALLDCKRLVIMPEAYYYYYFYNDTSMVHAYDEGLYENIKTLRNIIQSIFLQKARQNNLKIPDPEIERQCQREYIFLLMLTLKNEVRGNPGKHTYLKRIKEICKKEDTCRLCRKYPVAVTGLSNKLLFLVMKYPSGPGIRLLRAAMNLFTLNRRAYRKGKQTYES